MYRSGEEGRDGSVKTNFQLSLFVKALVSKLLISSL